MPTKAEIRSVIERRLDHWAVPKHLVAIADKHGKFSVKLLPTQGAPEAVSVDISTGLGWETIKSGIAELDRAIRAGRQRAQSDVEDFTEKPARW